MTASTLPPPRFGAGERWVAGIVVGLATVVAVNFYVAWLVRDVGFPLVRDDYYQAGLDYDRKVALGRRNAERSLALTADPAGRLTLQIAGQPIVPSDGLLRYYRADRPDMDFVTPAVVSADGRSLQPRQPPPLAGRWRIVFSGTIGGEASEIAVNYNQRGAP